jgi:hypothetical protein
MCVYVCVCVCTLTHIVGDKQYIICINLYEHNTGARCSEEPEKMRPSSDSKENTFYSKENTFYNREHILYLCKVQRRRASKNAVEQRRQTSDQLL